HQPLQFRRAANAADEVNAFARSRVVNAKQRRQDVFLEQRHVELFNRVGRRGEFRPEIERVPLAVEKKAQLMFARWLVGTVSLNDEYTVEQLEHARGRQPVQVFQHAVVGQNLHLVMRKNYGEKSGTIAYRVARLINPRGRRAAMMAVGDVEERDAGERLF